MFKIFNNNQQTKPLDIQRQPELPQVNIYEDGEEITLPEEDLEVTTNPEQKEKILDRNKDLDQAFSKIVSTNSAQGTKKSSVVKTPYDNNSGLMIILRQLEAFPPAKDVEQTRSQFSENIDRLEKAKAALQNLNLDPKKATPSIINAYSSVLMELKQTVIERDSFEESLLAKEDGINELLNIYKDSSELPKIITLASFYGFNLIDQKWVHKLISYDLLSEKLKLKQKDAVKAKLEVKLEEID